MQPRWSVNIQLPGIDTRILENFSDQDSTILASNFLYNIKTSIMNSHEHLYLSVTVICTPVHIRLIII